MAVSDARLRSCVRRLIKSRMRIITGHGFYGMLLMHMNYAVSCDIKTVRADGERIIFSPDFLEKLSDRELDYVLIHEILHIAFGHYLKRAELEAKIYDRAADIVVNSQILFVSRFDIGSITMKGYGAGEHLAPDGREGYKYTADEVYRMLVAEEAKAAGGGTHRADRDSVGSGGSWDDHNGWEAKEDERLSELWDKRCVDAAHSVMEMGPSLKYGTIPASILRKIRALKSPQTDWKTVLNEFIEEEITDFTFSPPDRRFDDCTFFLPDYNDKEAAAKDILFMIDISGSMQDEMIAAVYSEVKGALEQFDGRLKGWLGFFDVNVTKPKEFDSIEDILALKPVGGGGTSFHSIFRYVERNMTDNLPQCIVILTDGFAEFPEETAALRVPVLWILCNDSALPPWGKVARIS